VLKHRVHPFSELHLLHQLHGVLPVVGDRDGFEPPAVTIAVHPEADLGARSDPLFFHALVAYNRLHVFRRPVRVAQIVGEPELNTRAGHHVIGLGRDTCLRLQGRLGSTGAVIVDIRRRQTLGRTGRFVARHRRFCVECEESDNRSSKERSELFGHDDLL
jgi:hypothetical protein